MSTNWLSIVTADVSGPIGFGTASRVYHQSEGNVTCIRMERKLLEEGPAHQQAKEAQLPKLFYQVLTHLSPS